MQVVRHSNLAAFAALVRPLFMHDEAMHCLGLGMLHTLVTDPSQCPEPVLLSIESSERLVGVAWQTPPFPLGITQMTGEALDSLARYAATHLPSVGAVVGPRPAVDEFSERWQALTGCTLVGRIAQGIYQLTHVILPPTVPGGMRLASEQDRQLLAEWHYQFALDCDLASSRDEAWLAADHGLLHGNRVLWEDEHRPRAMAGFSGKTPTGVRVNYVYTPPEERGQGYASALVAQLSQHLLDGGNKCCFLYTDLKNPTSNRIYQRVGYRFVCESAHYRFSIP